MSRPMPALSFHKTKHRRRWRFPNPAKVILAILGTLGCIVSFLIVCLIFN